MLGSITWAASSSDRVEDKPEQKRETEGLGPIAITPAVKISLFVLRRYLAFMTLLLFYHVLGLAGIFGKQEISFLEMAVQRVFRKK
jgi:hypothetical protein